VSLPQDPDSAEPHRLSPSEQAFGDLLAAFEAHLPAMLGQLADLFGKSAPRISNVERRRFMAALRRRLRRLWPDLERLDALRTATDSLA
jgi:hypothetical protein